MNGWAIAALILLGTAGAILVLLTLAFVISLLML